MTLTPPPGRIYLLRHAKAAWAQPGQSDFDRPLDTRGYDEAELVTLAAAERKYRPDLVLSSTALRCRETARAVERAFPGDLEMRYVDQLYNCPTDAYVEMLSAIKDFGSIMVIGHNPAVEEFLAMLVGTDDAARAAPEGYPTSGLAVIDHGEQGWRLADFLRA